MATAANGVSNGTVRFQTNIPERVALAFPDGRSVQSQFGGDQILYTLVDGRKLYLSPFIARKIDALNLAPGEEFEICKREVVRGNRRSVEFEVTSLRPAVATGATNAAAPSGNGTAQPVTPPAYQQPPRPQAIPPAPQPEMPTIEAHRGRLLAKCLCRAVDAAIEAQAYAREKGLGLTFAEATVQDLATTLFIELCRAAARSEGRSY